MCDDHFDVKKYPGPGSVFELEGYGSILSGQYFENRFYVVIIVVFFCLFFVCDYVISYFFSLYYYYFK